MPRSAARQGPITTTDRGVKINTGEARPLCDFGLKRRLRSADCTQRRADCGGDRPVERDRNERPAACAEDAADRGPSALYGVLAGVDAVGLDLPEVRQLTRTANHQNQATADRCDGY
jgi:hypothetical protein